MRCTAIRGHQISSIRERFYASTQFMPSLVEILARRLHLYPIREHVPKQHETLPPLPAALQSMRSQGSHNVPLTMLGGRAAAGWSCQFQSLGVVVRIDRLVDGVQDFGRGLFVGGAGTTAGRDGCGG